MPRRSSRFSGGEEEEEELAIPSGRRVGSKKNAEIAMNRKRILDDDEDDNDSDGLNDSQSSEGDYDEGDGSNGRSSESEPEGAIRKKKRPKTDEASEEKKGDGLTGTIRRRARPEADADDTKPKSSLLGNMALPPPSKDKTSSFTNTNKTFSGSNAHHSNSTKGAGINSANNNNYSSYKGNNRRGDNRRQPWHQNNGNNQTVELLNLPHELTPAQQNINQPHSQPPGNFTNPHHSQINHPSTLSSSLKPASATTTVSEKRILSQLHQLCDSYQQTVIPPLFDFQRHQSSQSVDLMGSFLRGPSMTGVTDEYDFFDTNEQGEIVLQGRKPMFPEEFPPGMKEHELSWWGVLDPSVGRGRYKAPNNPEVTHTMEPQPPAPGYAAMNNPPAQQQQLKQYSPMPPYRSDHYTKQSDGPPYERQHSRGRGHRSGSGGPPPYHYEGGHSRRGGGGRR